MVTKVQTLIVFDGYWQQLDRARRFLARVEQMRFDRDSDDIDEHDFQDMMWAFFQNCWHVKDWVKNDPKLKDAQKRAVIAMAHDESSVLSNCQDLCNGTKHLGEYPGAHHAHIDSIFNAPGGVLLQRDCMVVDVKGMEVSGVELGSACIAEWERIFASQNLSTAWQS